MVKKILQGISANSREMNKNKQKAKKLEGRGYSSVAECVHSMHEVMGSVPSTSIKRMEGRKKKKERKRNLITHPPNK